MGNQNKSLSSQEVADILHVSRSTIYELIRRGDIRSYRVGRKVRFTQDDVDAYIARSRHEHQAPLTEKAEVASELLASEKKERGLIISGQDVVLDFLAGEMAERGHWARRSYLSSFEGLLALYEGRVDVVACHLYDGAGYNASFVRALMPGVAAVLVNVSLRKVGFYVRAENPKGITGWEDLKRRDIRLLNRRVGSSARILLDTMLKKMDVAQKPAGYERVMKSHLTMAAAVAAGEADVAIGTERISRQMDGIDFIPLMEERYDLVIKKEDMAREDVQTMLAVLRSKSFKEDISHFSGNDYKFLGQVVEEV